MNCNICVVGDCGVDECVALRVDIEMGNKGGRCSRIGRKLSYRRTSHDKGRVATKLCCPSGVSDKGHVLTGLPCAEEAWEGGEQEQRILGEKAEKLEKQKVCSLSGLHGQQRFDAASSSSSLKVEGGRPQRLG